MPFASAASAPAPASFAAPASDGGPAAEAPAPGAVDPLQWWGALTQQFTELATKAMRDSAAEAGRRMANAGTPTAGDDESTAKKAARKAAVAKPAGRSG